MRPLVLLVGLLLCVACTSHDGAGDAGANDSTEGAVVRQYAVNQRANYQDIVTQTQTLQKAISAFVGEPHRDDARRRQEGVARRTPSVRRVRDRTLLRRPPR